MASLTRHSLAIFLAVSVCTVPLAVTNQGATIAVIVAIASVAASTISGAIVVVFVVVMVAIIVVVIVMAGDEKRALIFQR